MRSQVGFKGSRHEFFDYMRTNPKFQPKSKEELEQGFAAVKKKVEAKVPQFFLRTPKAGLVIRPYPAFREKFEAGGSYEQGTPDGSRPGTFYFNAYDLPSRFTWEETTLFMHEGEPGHHFQISLAQENPSCPPSCASAATPLMSKAGRSTRNPSATRCRCTPTPTSASAI